MIEVPRLRDTQAIHVSDCQSDTECCERIEINRVWKESFEHEPAGLTGITDPMSELRLHEDPLLWAESTPWDSRFESLLVASHNEETGRTEYREEIQRLAQVIILYCKDTRPQYGNADLDYTFPRNFWNSRIPGKVFLLPQNDPNEVASNGPWWFRCIIGSVIVRDTVSIWPWLAFEPLGKNSRKRHRCVNMVQTKEESMRVTIQPGYRTCLDCGTQERLKIGSIRNVGPRPSVPLISYIILTAIPVKVDRNKRMKIQHNCDGDPLRSAISTMMGPAMDSLQEARPYRACLYNNRGYEVDLVVRTLHANKATALDGE